MPRVYKRTRKRREIKKPMRCTASPCVVAQQRLGVKLENGVSMKELDDATEVKVGDSYYIWHRRMGRSSSTYMQHVECGYPKRSQLSSRKTVAIEDAIDEANRALADWTPALDDDHAYTGGYDDVTSALSGVGEVARDVGQEYQDGFDAMPEGLNQGDTGQAMEAVAQELDSWADDLDSWTPQHDEPEIPERDEGEDDDAYRDRCEEALETWASDVRSEAEDAMSDMPEYQG